MTDLHSAVGNLITGKIAGSSLDKETEQLIRQGTMGGVTLFKDNVADLDQLLELIDLAHSIAPEPFLVAVDQEGGAVQRFDDVITAIPSAMAIGAIADRTAAMQLISIAAQQLHWLGVNCNLAPVLDVNSNPLNPIIATRAYGSDPITVSQIGDLVSQAYADQAVLPVGKHFPGHGDTAEDSHLALAVAHGDAAALNDRELLPFARLAHSLPAMLVGHVWLPAYDEKPLPASLSHAVTTDLLRNQLGFGGFIMTDDMPVMKAIVDHWGLEEAAVMAVAAGADNVLISGTVEQIQSVHAALTKAFQSGVLNQSQLGIISHRRANAMQICMSIDKLPLEQRRALLKNSLKASQELALKVACSSVCLFKGTVANLSAPFDEWIVLAPAHPRYSLDLFGSLAKHTPPGGGTIRERRFAVNPDSAEIEDVVTFAAGKKCLLLTYRALLNKGQLQLASRLATEIDPASIVVACDVPYELASMSDFANAIATFDPSELAMCALAEILLGKSRATGICPVDVR